MKPLIDLLENTLTLINVLVVDDDHDDTAIIKDTIEEVSSKHTVHCLHRSEKRKVNYATNFNSGEFGFMCDKMVIGAPG